MIENIKYFLLENNMKRLDVTGNVGQDPVVRVSKEGKQFITFSLAAKANFKQEKPEWVEIICNENHGLFDTIKTYVKKGAKLQCSGTNKVTPFLKKDGTPSCVERLYLKEFEFLSSKDDVTKVDSDPLNNVTPLVSEDLPIHLDESES